MEICPVTASIVGVTVQPLLLCVTGFGLAVADTFETSIVMLTETFTKTGGAAPEKIVTVDV